MGHTHNNYINERFVEGGHCMHTSRLISTGSKKPKGCNSKLISNINGMIHKTRKEVHLAYNIIIEYISVELTSNGTESAYLVCLTKCYH